MRVCEYFAGKHIFITGGSGFVGKVLIEKLLRSCPGIEKIYMLIRPKKGKDIQERLEAIVKLPLFEKLREINPDALSKIHPISGDVMELNLGMTEEDRRLVSENCHIFYHSAASVRFDDSLKYAIIMNVRGTRETAALALECKKLEAFVHISTTYCNIDRHLNEVVVYNGSKYKYLPTTTGEIVQMGADLIWDTPYEQILWYPWFKMTRCWYDYYIKVLVYHMLPAVFLDLALRVAGMKPIVFKIQRKIYIANVVLFYFISHTWHFVNDRSMSLRDTIEDERDIDEFKFWPFLHMTRREVYEYYRDGMCGTARYLFKEKLDFDKNRKNTWRFYVVDRIFWTAVYTTILWYLFIRLDVLSVLWSSLCNYIEKL
ncbi:unnamed protein product [Acanthoscelides obtectus]|uniref:Fatty acyl-CoA reductase n=1 Tax=Acanthoscelides obtectus TaxID=200917 RepID=A0A9P0LZP7_ACAOB|nr:unnamed protein product [Acanthoscelides obtectus]CAK1645880.1 Putative fatty acyl-CoA reductase CG5065 [Acanthoscelides obtectus]